MKSELVDLKPTEPGLTYPCLRESKESGEVVLFTSPHTGTAVKSEVHPLGTYSANWWDATDTELWKTPEKGVLLTP